MHAESATSKLEVYNENLGLTEAVVDTFNILFYTGKEIGNRGHCMELKRNTYAEISTSFQWYFNYIKMEKF